MKHFQILIIVLWAISLISSCKHEKSLNPVMTIITGEISNLDKHKTKRWIEIVHPDLFSQEASFIPVEIDSLGQFRFEMEIVSPSLCWGIYNKWFPFVISPGDSLHFTIDANIWNDTIPGNLDKGKYTTISGIDNEDYHSIIAFQNWASDSVYTVEKSRKKNNAIATYTPQEFKHFIQNKEKYVLDCIKRFGTKVKAGKLFYRILEEEIKYRTLEDLMLYWSENVFHGCNKLKDIELPKDYFSLLEKYQMDNHDFFVGGRIGFIRSLEFYLQFQNPRERETFLDIYEHKETAKIKADYFNNQANYLYSQSNGITRDLMLHFFALYNLDKVPSKSKDIYASVSDLIVDSYVKEQFEKQFKLKSEKVNPQIDIISNEENTVLDSVISKYPGKVIYVDFWAPWCGPCMGDMSYSKKLRESFKGDDIIFVYLACDCALKPWKAAIGNKDINGINLLLSNNDYGKLKRRYEISGIPHYLLVNKKGEIVNKNAPRPSDDNIKAAILELL